MGGMISENRSTAEDKIPFFGDIPYLGQLFRSKAENSVKVNLLIFVTARLVDPAGRSVKTSTEPVLLPKVLEEGARSAAPSSEMAPR
jgi:general secretion pathway protein D